MRSQPQLALLMLTILFTLGAAWSPPTERTHAQNAAPFTLYFYDGTTHTLNALSPTQGVTDTIDLTPVVEAPADVTQPPALAVSPDGEQLAACSPTASGTLELRLITLNPTLERRATLDLGAGVRCALGAASWADDSGSLAVGITRWDLFPDAFSGEDLSNRGPVLDIAVVDASTTTVTASTMAAGLDISMQSFGGMLLVDYVPGAEVLVQLFGWEGAGLPLLWDVPGGQTTQPPQGFGLMERLPATGEIVFPLIDERYTVRAPVGLGDVPYNVVRLGQQGDPPANSRTIYSTGTTPNAQLWDIAFVNDGRTLLIRDGQQVTLIERDGSFSKSNIAEATVEIIGTPSGFVVINRPVRGYQVLHYDLNRPAPLTLLDVGDANDAYLSWRYVGGSRITGDSTLPPFSTELDTIANSETIAALCAGVTPAPRLDNGTATMIDSVPNNVRAAPTTNAEVVGQLAPGDELIVLTGPVCAEGLAWYEIFSGPLQGWTVEGADGVYWVENSTR